MNRIRELRELRGMTQQELGDKMGVTQSAIHKYETGQSNLSLPKAIALAGIFGVSLNQLVSADAVE